MIGDVANIPSNGGDGGDDEHEDDQTPPPSPSPDPTDGPDTGPTEAPGDDGGSTDDKGGKPSLPLTGSALTGLIIAALVAVGAGGGALYLSRKRTSSPEGIEG